MRMLKTCVWVGAIVLGAGAAQAQVAWSQPSGNGGFFNYANGHNATGLFGSPSLVGNTFYFFPVNFVANSSGGSPSGGPLQVTATDTFDVDLFVHAGYKFDGVSIT